MGRCVHYITEGLYFLSCCHCVVVSQALDITAPLETGVEETVAAFDADVEEDHPGFGALRLVLVEDGVVVAARRAYDILVRQGRICAQVVCYTRLLLCDGQKIVSVHASVVRALLGTARATPEHHNAARGIRFWGENVVTFLTKAQGGHGG